MTLSDISIKNPVFAVMLSAAMIVFGYMGYLGLGISQFPEIDFPVVNVTTYREAADPETMDFDVTDIIEDAISGVEGIDYVQSQSLEGVSVVTVFFHLSRNIDVAMQDVQNAVGSAANRLPNDIDPPIISKVNFNKFPVIWLSIHGHRPLREIADFVDTQLKQQVETIPGCGGVMYGGLRRRNMRLWLDGKKLQAFNLDDLDVMRALRAEHVEKPAGYLQSNRREINLRVMGEARTAEEFEQVPIVNRGGQVIKVGDVATVEDGLEDRRSFARFNREPNVGIGVMRATGANVVEVCGEVKRRLPALRKLLPPDMEIGISTDYSLFIIDDIEEVKQSLLFGICLTAVVTFLFLGSLGSTLNVCISIPTSLVGTFMAIKWFGFTVNFMTLLALSLSVGVVVDDAMVVLENIYRRREHGEGRKDAAIRGAREISFAAIAATLSIAAIFIPVAFMKGSIGLFFYQFGITVTVAVLLSLVISLTITPMLCSFFLVVRKKGRPCPPAVRGVVGAIWTGLARLHWLFDRWILEPILLWPMDWLMTGLSRGYAWGLRHALRHQWWVVPSSLALAASSLIFAFGLDVPLPAWVSNWTGITRVAVKPIGRELVPSEDQNRFIVNVICPVGSSIDYVDMMLKRGEDALIGLKDPVTGQEVAAGMFAAVSIRPGSLISEGILFVRLIPANERSWTQTDCMNQLRAAFVGSSFETLTALEGSDGERDLVLEGKNGEHRRRLADDVHVVLDGKIARLDDIKPGMKVSVSPAGGDDSPVTLIDARYQRSDGVPGVRVVVLDLSTQGFTATRGYPVDFAVQGPRWENVTELSERIRERLSDSGVVTDVNSDYRPGMPEVRIVPDKNKAAELGVPIQRLANVLNVAFGGVRNGRFTDQDKRYDVRLRYLEQQRDAAEKIPDVYIKTDTGKLVPLRDVTKQSTVTTLPVINRYNHLRKVEITANMAPGVAQGEAIARSFELAEQVREEMGLDPRYRIVQLGNAVAMQQTIDSLWWALALGFVVAYMILGVQFNSFVHPFTVLMAVPFGVTGALATLWLFNDTLNLMSMIGMVLLAGLVKKNSIILVDYTNQLRAQGLELKEAVLTACPIRLRPILMTSLATMSSAVPLALGYGPGAETRAPLARSIIGGIMLSTLVTLIIVPILYVLFDRFGHMMMSLTRRDRARSGDEAIQTDGHVFHRRHALEPATIASGAPNSREPEIVLDVRLDVAKAPPVELTTSKTQP
jgi:HAE1 family hydrophobic/amphiphilic exporter-1